MPLALPQPDRQQVPLFEPLPLAELEVAQGGQELEPGGLDVEVVEVLGLGALDPEFLVGLGVRVLVVNLGFKFGFC